MMGKGRTHKKQHFVPKAYLAAWCDPDCPPSQDPFIWLFNLGDENGRRKAPQNVFTETDMYTVHTPDGGRDLTLEAGLAGLETGIQALRRDFVVPRRPLPFARHVKLAAFVAVMFTRTRSFRDFQKKQFAPILKRIEYLEASESDKHHFFDAALPADGMSVGIAQMRQLAENPLPLLIATSLETVAPVLAQMQLSIFCAAQNATFITSDAPVGWLDPTRDPKSPWGTGVMAKNIEVTMPLSPRHLVAFTHENPVTPGVKPVRYREVADEVVHALNFRAASLAGREIVSNSPSLKPLFTERAANAMFNGNQPAIPSTPG